MDYTSSSAPKEKHPGISTADAQSQDAMPEVEMGFVDDVLLPTNRFQKWSVQLETMLGMEARGIQRVPEELRRGKTGTADYIQMCLIWFSANVTANNTLLGLLGPLLFDVGLKDGMIIACCGAFCGAAASGYISTFGPASGCRTLVIARFTMGWWPSRLCVALNIVIMVGYGLVDMLLTGQILSAVNGGGMTIIVGTIISAIVTLIICLFGMKLFHTYERYAFIPQLIVLLILVGCAGPYWDASTPTEGPDDVAVADRMSFFFLCMSGCLAWAAASADFYVYFPADANRWKVWTSTTLGLGGACAFTYMIGVGIASGVANNPAWAAANDNSTGALMDAVFAPLGSFGHFCSVIVALGLIANKSVLP